MHSLHRAKLIYELHLKYESVLQGKSNGIPNEFAYECVAEEIDPRKVIALFIKGYKPQDLVQEIQDVTPSCYEKETYEEEQKCLEMYEAELFKDEPNVYPRAYTKQSHGDEDNKLVCSSWDFSFRRCNTLHRVNNLLDELTESH